MTDVRTVYVTTGSDLEARAIARALLEERLIACANILPNMRSLYRWEGGVQEDEEVAMLLKTRAELVERVVARVEALHTYDVPCVVVWPIDAGADDYLAWVRAETG